MFREWQLTPQTWRQEADVLEEGCPREGGGRKTKAHHGDHKTVKNPADFEQGALLSGWLSLTAHRLRWVFFLVSVGVRHPVFTWRASHEALEALYPRIVLFWSSFISSVLRNETDKFLALWSIMGSSPPSSFHGFMETIGSWLFALLVLTLCFLWEWFYPVIIYVSKCLHICILNFIYLAL